MLQVSFAMTTEAYSDRTKTETRRFWKPRHAAKFKPGVMFMGLSKDLRAKGKRIHPARVIFCEQERLGDMNFDSFLREGGFRYWIDTDDYIKAMGGPDLEPYVLRFQHMSEEETERMEALL